MQRTTHGFFGTFPIAKKIAFKKPYSSMPQRTNEFQHLIVLIEKALAGGKTTVSESRMLPDKITGDEREVDIVIEREEDLHSILIGIECTGGDSHRAATVEWMEQMHGKHINLTDKLVLVAKAGFTKSAKKKAEFLRIKTLTLDEAENCEWETGVHKTPAITIESFLCRTLLG